VGLVKLGFVRGLLRQGRTIHAREQGRYQHPEGATKPKPLCVCNKTAKGTTRHKGSREVDKTLGYHYCVDYKDVAVALTNN
jgi:hypothetical protein